MPTPAFVGAGTQVASANNVAASTTLSPTAPAERSAGNLLVLITNSRSRTASCATPSGWNTVTGFPVASATTSGGKIYVFTRIADGTSNDNASCAWTSLTSGTSGDSTTARILAYSNATETRDSIAGTLTDSTATTSFNIPSITTNTDDALVIGIGMRVHDTAHTFTVASPYTERTDGHTTSGTGHGTIVSERIGAAGTVSATAITPSNTTSVRVLATAVAFEATPTVTTANAQLARGSANAMSGEDKVRPYLRKTLSSYNGHMESGAVSDDGKIAFYTAPTVGLATLNGGVTWTSVSLPNTVPGGGSPRWVDVAYGNGYFVMTGYGVNSPNNFIAAYATDPTTGNWTMFDPGFTTISSAVPTKVEYGNGWWMISNGGNQEVAIINGDPTGTWTINSSTTQWGASGIYVNRIRYFASSNTWVIGTGTGQNNFYRTGNPDGAFTSTGVTAQWQNIDYDGTTYVATSVSGSSYYTATALNSWTTRTQPGGTSYAKQVAYDGLGSWWIGGLNTNAVSRELYKTTTPANDASWSDASTLIEGAPNATYGVFPIKQARYLSGLSMQATGELFDTFNSLKSGHSVTVNAGLASGTGTADNATIGIPELIVEEETYENATVDVAVISAGTIFDSAVTNGGTPTVRTTNPLHGSKHARHVSNAGASMTKLALGTARSLVYARFYMYFDSLPATNTTISGWHDTSTTTTVRAGLQLQAGGTIRIRNGLTATDTSTTALSTGTWYRFEWEYDYANTTQTLRVWTGANIESSDPADAVELKTGVKELSGTLDTGTTEGWWVGPNDTPGATTVTYDIDSVAWGDADWIGPYDTGVTPITGTDSTQISSSETAAITNSFSGTDSTQITSTETASITSSQTNADSTNITSSDVVSQLLSTLNRPDTTDIASTEGRTILSTLSRTDTTDIGSSETSSVVVQISSSDSTLISSSETSSILSTLTRTDTTQITSAETSSFAQVNFTRTDSTEITGTDASNTTATFPGSDATLISSSETSEVIATGSFDKSGSDSTDIGSSETSSVLVILNRPDTTEITTTEGRSFAQSNFSATDSTQITSAETASILSTLSRTDSTEISSSETSSVVVQVTSADSTQITSAETTAIQSTLSRTDSTQITSAETSAIQASLTRTDSTEISSTETSSVSGTVTAFDTTQISSTDSGSTAVTLHVSSSDSTQISSSETSNVDLGGTQLIRHHERFNGGADGVAITSSNSLFTLFPGTGTMEFSSDYPIQGGTGGLFISTTAAQGKRGKIENLVSRRTWYARFYYYKTGNPSGVNRFMIFETSAGAQPPGVDIAGIREEANGNLTLYNGSAWVTGTPISSLANGWHRIEMKVDRDGDLSTLRVWSGANMHSTGTADQEIQVSLTDNGDEISVVGIGNYNAVNHTRYIEDFAVGDQAWIGPSANIDLSATDSTQISSTDSGAITVPISSADSTQISSSETSAIQSTLNRSDSTEITSTDSGSFATVQFTSTDSTQITSADSGSVFVDNPGSDSTQIGSSETSDIQVSGTFQVSSDDSTQISSSETSATTAGITGTDSTQITSSETSSFATVVRSASDTTDIGSTETTSLFVTVTSSDSTQIISSETSEFGTVIRSAADSTEITGSDSSSFGTVAFTRTDSTEITSSETSSFGQVNFSSSDSTQITSTDSGLPQAQFPGSDSTQIGSSETSDVQISGGNDLSSSDSTEISSAETSSMLVMITSTDTTQVTGTDAGTFGQVNFTRTDSTDIGSAETATLSVTLGATDSTEISSSETSDIQTSGAFDVNGSDATEIGSSETSSLVVTVAVSSSDSTQITSTDASSFGQVNFASADTTQVTTQEAASVYGTVTSTDSTEIASADSGIAIGQFPGADSTIISSSETSDIQVIGTIQITSDDTTEITSSEFSVQNVQLVRTDATQITSSETASVYGTVASADSTQISSTETESFNDQPITSDDQTEIGSAETSDLFILIAITSDDNTEISSTDQGFVGEMDIGEVSSRGSTQNPSAGVQGRTNAQSHVSSSGETRGGVRSS